MENQFIFKYSAIYDKNWSLALHRDYDRGGNKEKFKEFLKDFSE